MTAINRRNWGVTLGAGALALGAGAWWQDRLSAANAAGAPPADGVLPQPLTTLDGKTLNAGDLAGRAVVLNFWAPWCPPCVKEMPELDRFARSPAGKDTLVIGLAIDEDPAVRKWIAAHPVGFPISILGYAGLAWVGRLGNDAKVLPFSVVYDRSHRLVQHKVGPTSEAELARWARTF
jgi:thiol-disulfide isomerase/thioredoxin